MHTVAIRALSRDQKLGMIIKKIGPIILEPKRIDPYKSIIRAIVYQQLAGKAAETIFHRFIALSPKSSFPSAEFLVEAKDELLRSAGLSGMKVKYIKAVATKALAGEIPSLKKCDTMSDTEIIDSLTTINGVGRWTAEMFLISNMGRLDVLPVNDLGVRKGFQVVYNKKELPVPDRLFEFGKRWAPYRTYATLYLWRAADLQKIKSEPKS
jgi:DNA-3-methyladenine glycosylase II